MKTIKLTILSLVFFAFTISVHAQDKYQFAIVAMTSPNHTLYVSINGETYQEIKAEKGELCGSLCYTPLLKKVNEMQDQGWEVFSTDKGVYEMFYHLRKKK